MTSHIMSVGLQGMKGHVVRVEASVRNDVLSDTVAFQKIHETCGLSNNQAKLIVQTCFEQKWSNRTQVKLIRIARTFSDLEGAPPITDSALQEAIDWKHRHSLLPQSPMQGGH